MIWKNRKFIVIMVVAVLLAAGGYRYFSTRGTPPQYEWVTVERGNIIQAVAVTGKVKPAQAVELAFERSGKVARVAVAVGGRVARGTVLVSLTNAELAAQLNEANARVDSAEAQLAQYQAAVAVQTAKLDELKLGTRREQLQVKEAELEKARQDLANAYGDVPGALATIYTQADDAVRLKTAALYEALSVSTYQLTYSVCDRQAESDATWLRYLSELELTAWQPAVTGLTPASPRPNLESALAASLDRLAVLKRFLDRTGDTLALECTLRDASLDGYRTDVNTARTTVAGLAADVSDLQQAISVQQRTVERVERELDLQRAGSTEQQISAQAAAVRQAEANVSAQRAQVRQWQAGVANIAAQLDKTVLHAPLTGVVTLVDAEVGEIVSPNATVISLMSDAGFEIEANVPEADIAKIKLGDAAELTLDAYGSDVLFLAQVVQIDPAETVVEGVPTYRVTLHFKTPDARVKSGMTANLDIQTAERNNVIVIPQRAVASRNGEKQVKKFVTGSDGKETVVAATVETGLRGSDGNIEIISGLAVGDRIVPSAPQE